jgi:hypothetical protein
MASVHNDLLDDPITADGDTSFVLGQQSAQQEQAIPKTAFASAQNMDFDPFGRLVTRRGAKSSIGNVALLTWGAETDTWTGSTKLWGSGLSAGVTVDSAAFFPTGTSAYVVVAQGGVLKRATESAALATIAGSAYTGNFVYFGQLGTRLYYCDGNAALAYIDSAAANQAVSAGRVTSIKITTQGSGYVAVPAVTFSSGAAAATAVLGYGGRVVSATITTPSSGYSATTPPGVSFAAAPAGGVTALGRVNISQTPSKPKYLVAHTNRLFCTTADTAIPADTVYASDFLDGESWDLVGASVRVGGDGDPITALYPWINNNLIVFKQRSIHMIVADPLIDPSLWVIKLLSNRIGCVSHRSVQAVGADIYFLAQDGVRSISQIQSGAVADIGQPLSFPIQDQIDALTRANQAWICSAYYKNRYFLSVATGEGATPTITGCMVWNQLTQSWMSKWTGWQPREFFISGFSGRLRLNFADAQGKLWTWDDFTNVSAETSDSYLDDSSAYESYVITRGYDCGDPLVDKTGHTLQLFTENRLTNQAMTCYAYYDRDMSGTWTALSTSIPIAANDRWHRRTFNLLPKGKWNCLQVKYGANAGKVVLVMTTVTAFADNIKPELS